MFTLTCKIDNIKKPTACFGNIETHALWPEGVTLQQYKDFSKLYHHETALSQSMLEQGVSSAGDLSNLRRVIRNALQGKAST